MIKRIHRPQIAAAVSALALACAAAPGAQAQTAGHVTAAPNTATPIKHLVVIFQENVSFDHYFGTYPKATNPKGEPAFHAAPATPEANTLLSAGLLEHNPNKTNAGNGADAALPFRLDRTQAATADQNHGYTAEQAAYDGGKMDLFPANTGRGSKGGAGSFGTKGQVMGYFDGNTVTALWNYAQNFAMSDNSFSTTFGPSSPGAINLVSGQTNGVMLPVGATLEADGTYDKGRVVPDGQGGWTMISDLDPTGDVCSHGKTALMTGRNIGDMLNARGITWGWFEGGFDLSVTNPNGTTGCGRKTTSAVTHVNIVDYIPHHEPFQYYPSTANPTHKRPASVAVIGTDHDGGANHQYDMKDWYAALDADNLPAVSFLKAPGFEDGHAGYSDPLDGQHFIVRAVNAVEKSKFWKDTAIIVLYDDSDGWYDHAHAVINPSYLRVRGYDVLDGGKCGTTGVPLPGVQGKPAQGRCGYGTRQPFVVISPYAKPNYIDHTLTDQTSVMRFIEDNWMGGQRLGQGSFDAVAGSIDGMFDWAKPTAHALILDPKTGAPLHS
ncbi:phospholipase C [Defluviimonas sp. 20V17]|uniref:Phospholipase C n=1 Tax=Allgaiera indica TaxID=765699 RepID=A0AAN4UNU7_9RHOB|nr:alkaline phosphatase family protein [Allgaiera indica]KDB04045.1 phospholipase C [Defluviimonas sp. 20V17]GHD99413.1 phospholipase C [Allgaiera indica]SDW26517.1 phospholipase C [Allgaiera indica]